MPLVYMVTNTTNSNFYIGVTRRSLDGRKASHLSAVRAGRKNVPKLYNAIRKYGEEAFAFETLAVFDELKDAMEFERKTIKDLSPSYNLIAGGYGPSGHKWTETQRATITEKAKGRKHSPRTIAAMKAAKAGKDYGRPVLCLDDGVVHANSKEAGKHYGVSPGGVRAVCHGKWQKTGVSGLHFIFSNKIMEAESRSKLIAGFDAKATANRRIPGLAKARFVVCLTSGQQFRSAVDASIELGISKARVMQLCQRGGHTKGGIRMSYLDEIDTPKIPPPKRKYENGTSGVTGVFKHPNGKCKAYVDRNSKRINVGTFDTLEEAIAARERFLEAA